MLIIRNYLIIDKFIIKIQFDFWFLTIDQRIMNLWLYETIKSQFSKTDIYKKNTNLMLIEEIYYKNKLIIFR